MSIQQSTLIDRLKNVDRWLPRMHDRTGRRVSRPARPRPESLEISSYLDDDLRITQTSQPSLDEVIERLDAGDLPEHGALLGSCDDSLPFLLDLANPSPGALLMTSDSGGGKTALIRSILTSASRMNPPERVCFDLIAAQPDEYQQLETSAHCRSIQPVEDSGVDELISQLVRLADKRKKTGPVDPAVILAIDGLASLLPFLSEEAFSNLYWLIRHGPRYMIWTIAALPSAQAQQVEPRYLTAFRTRLFGYMRDERLAHRMANDDSIAARDLEKGRQFYVPYGGDWLRFWICTETGADALNIPTDISLDLEGGVG